MIHVALMGEIVMNPHHPLLRLLLVPKDTQRLIAHKELPMEFVIQWVISFITYLFILNCIVLFSKYYLSLSFQECNTNACGLDGGDCEQAAPPNAYLPPPAAAPPNSYLPPPGQSEYGEVQSDYAAFDLRQQRKRKL